MNQATKDIAKLLDISLDDALKVQNRMSTDGFDFSECLERELRNEAEETWKEIILEEV